MSYSVEIKTGARRELRQLPKDVLSRIDPCIASLSDDPRPHGCKKLRSTTPEAWRVRVGSYRILYQIDDPGQKVLILRIVHRREAY